MPSEAPAESRSAFVKYIIPRDCSAGRQLWMLAFGVA